ncbi:DUF4951 domain-containing protein [Acinetobacter lactucae]|uniref:DUF4951 domain-containing protein n=1 Tax=Acinetobacter lactucae TaxID=1785128 RepID=UPI001580A995|nr:DUF4951 domain-containing protein [Acinetobacter lactucae]NUF36109.1 DUF4951 domain-containing protein [Acinetobacter lactucae]NUG21774.1 DUF4951 domain-containing protein [Acinetobacter lactucae]
MWKYLFSIFCFGANIHCYAEFGTTNYFVSPTAQLSSDILPATPKNIPLPAFGQRIIGWGTGAEGARQRLENIQPADVSMIKKQGATLEMITAWQDFYEQEQQRNANNPTAKYRARLMKKIADLW